MPLVLACIGSRFIVFVATYIAGSLVTLNIYFKAATLISVPGKPESGLSIGM